MTTRAKRTYTEAQENYMLAKAALEVIGRTDNNGDAYCDALMLRAQAEASLINWAKEYIANHPKFAARFGDVERVFTSGIKFPAIRSKLIEACMQLEHRRLNSAARSCSNTPGQGEANMQKHTPYQKIMRAANRGTGLRLSPDEVSALSRDQAIQQVAMDDTCCPDCGDPCGPGHSNCPAWTDGPATSRGGRYF